MPLDKDTLKTKLYRVDTPLVQKTLNQLKQAGRKLSNVKIQQASLFAETENGIIKIGDFNDEYFNFLQSLHAPQIETKITGGTYLIFDEYGYQCKEVFMLSDLPVHEQAMLTAGEWSYIKKKNGLNVTVK